MEYLPNCPKCSSSYAYEDGSLLICPECGHEWAKDEPVETEATITIKDAHGNILNDGDSVTVIKDIKVKGASNPIKAGTKIKGIRLIEPVNGHNLDVNIKGFGDMLLKSELVKKCQE
ncbi:MAG: alkylphosphonate utilization protein [Verrucomicrobia bacterium]|nr:alkylphosphonate utilization protein [Verrucomicrobiota bacterium]MBS0637714.1 alkylphosphonate utilization protein [Verrucomicrobiota bacterium]